MLRLMRWRAAGGVLGRAKRRRTDGSAGRARMQGPSPANHSNPTAKNTYRMPETGKAHQADDGGPERLVSRSAEILQISWFLEGMVGLIAQPVGSRTRNPGPLPALLPFGCPWVMPSVTRGNGHAPQLLQPLIHRQLHVHPVNYLLRCHQTGCSRQSTRQFLPGRIRGAR